MPDITITLDHIILDLQRMMRAYTIRQTDKPVSLLKRARQQQRENTLSLLPPAHFNMTPKVALMHAGEEAEALYDAVKTCNTHQYAIQGDVDNLSGTLAVTVNLVHPDWRLSEGETIVCSAGTPSLLTRSSFVYQPILSQSMIARHRNTAFSAFNNIRQLELMLEHQHRYVGPTEIHSFRQDVFRQIDDNERIIQQVWGYLVNLKDRADYCANDEQTSGEIEPILRELTHLSAIIKPFGFDLRYTK